MDGKQFHLRTRIVLILLAAVLLVFTWVLYDLQVVHGSYYLEQSTRKIANTETVQAARGDILDRYGRVLVSNRITYQVTLDTSLMGGTQGRNSTILALLEICREQGVEWSDSLPVTATRPFRYTVDDPYENIRTDDNGNVTTSPTLLTQLTGALEKFQLPQDPTPQELVDALRVWFEVDESLGETEGRALVGVLYEQRHCPQQRLCLRQGCGHRLHHRGKGPPSHRGPHRHRYGPSVQHHLRRPPAGPGGLHRRRGMGRLQNQGLRHERHRGQIRCGTGL